MLTVIVDQKKRKESNFPAYKKQIIFERQGRPGEASSILLSLLLLFSLFCFVLFRIFLACRANIY